MSSQKNGDSPSGDPAKERAIVAFMKDEGLPALARDDCTLRPPALTGTWAYPDIVVNVSRIAASFAKGKASADDKLVSQPLVRVGGAVLGEAPVYPLTYSAPHHTMTPASLGEIPYNVTELNALVLSPDGTELGVVVHANCMEWCDEFQVARMPASRFASLVYNDTGFRALERQARTRRRALLARGYVDRVRASSPPTISRARTRGRTTRTPRRRSRSRSIAEAMPSARAPEGQGLRRRAQRGVVHGADRATLRRVTSGKGPRLPEGMRRSCPSGTSRCSGNARERVRGKEVDERVRAPSAVDAVVLARDDRGVRHELRRRQAGEANGRVVVERSVGTRVGAADRRHARVLDACEVDLVRRGGHFTEAETDPVSGGGRRLVRGEDDRLRGGPDRDERPTAASIEEA